MEFISKSPRETKDLGKKIGNNLRARILVLTGELGSGKTTLFIDEILKDKGKNIKDIKEIEVDTGPGSFTGLRVGVSVANALGWSLGIPVQAEIRYN